MGENRLPKFLVGEVVPPKILVVADGTAFLLEIIPGYMLLCFIVVFFTQLVFSFIPFRTICPWLPISKLYVTSLVIMPQFCSNL